MLSLPRAVLILSLLTTVPAFAQNVAFGGIRADTSAPVELAADSLQVNQSDGTAVFTGNVVIGQGEMRLSADEVTVVYADGDQQKIDRLQATGNVTLVNGPDAAEASEAEYDVATGNIALSGDVVLTQGQNVLRGDRMTVNLAEGSAQVDGRVRSVLQPGGN
ncbi:lipopolysaccharide transport periplasmic protein LptA (plasmid) [Paracoccus sp. TK19116]|uniref:Lipopolysaccharide export system protein LptA n=1 Tax=Paracoccus albicereus TaxID=2922394 RepID=A0ABT1MLQ8_9RHOB|nr:lipopolysaccharide transport periplasmic protein LptA [Paracoccus albicereus]MCQ0969024.1 lipopolysaccharide transport periplasmic protein LptA [Paracoccus albicereus]